MSLTSVLVASSVIASACVDPNISIEVTDPDTAEPVAVDVVLHGVDGRPIETTRFVGRGKVAAPRGGSITVIDPTSRRIITWLGVQPGDELVDGAAPLHPLPEAREGKVRSELRFARVPESTQYMTLRGPMAEQALAAGQFAVATVDAPDFDHEQLLTWTVQSQPLPGRVELPFSVAAIPLRRGEMTIDASTTLLPAIVETEFSLEGGRPFVSWIATEELAGKVQAGRLRLTWGSGDRQTEWLVRFPYSGDELLLPALPPEASSLLPTGPVQHRVALVDASDAAAARAFRTATHPLDSQLDGLAPFELAPEHGITRLVQTTHAP